MISEHCGAYDAVDSDFVVDDIWVNTNPSSTLGVRSHLVNSPARHLSTILPHDVLNNEGQLQTRAWGPAGLDLEIGVASIAGLQFRYHIFARLVTRLTLLVWPTSTAL